MPTGEVVFTVKRPGELVAKHTLTVTAGVVDNVSFDIDVTQGDQLYFDYIVRDPELADRMGAAGRESVRERFLITRYLRDYLRVLRVLAGIDSAPSKETPPAQQEVQP